MISALNILEDMISLLPFGAMASLSWVNKGQMAVFWLRRGGVLLIHPTPRLTRANWLWGGY